MDKNLADAELKIVGYLDTHARVARTVAYVMAAINAILIITSILSADLVRAAVCAGSAIALVWLLYKTRPATAPAP